MACAEGPMSHISFMPKKQLGLAIFVNEGNLGAAAADLVSGFVYDWLTGIDVMEKYKGKLQEYAPIKNLIEPID